MTLPGPVKHLHGMALTLRHRTRANAVKVMASLALLLVPLASGCAVNPVTGQREVVLMSEQRELALGRQYNQQVLASQPAYDNPQLARYIQQVGERLAAHSHRSELVYRFTLLDSPDVNAFALPGGYIYIYRGLLQYLSSEAQLAAVLGHEIGHVTARHAVRQQTAATGANLAYTLGRILVPELGSQAGQSLSNLLAGAALAGYGREHELEADRLSAQYLAKSGYDPQAILEVLRRLKAQDEFSARVARAEGRQPQSYHGLFATHPDSDTRLQQVIGEATYLTPAPDQAATTVGNFRQQTEGLVFGDSAADGVRRGNHFYHGKMGFAVAFPDGWVLKNLPDRVVAVAPGGKAQAQLLVQDLNKRITPEQFLRTRLGMDKLRRGEVIHPGGLDGYTALTRLNTAKGQREGRVAVIYLGTRAFILMGVALEGDSSTVAGQLRDTALSFHPLTAEERKLAEPLRLHWLRATARTRYEKLAAKSRIPGYPLEQLRLLNGHWPDGEPKPGEWIKTVR